MMLFTGDCEELITMGGMLSQLLELMVSCPNKSPCLVEFKFILLKSFWFIIKEI